MTWLGTARLRRVRPGGAWSGEADEAGNARLGLARHGCSGTADLAGTGLLWPVQTRQGRQGGGLDGSGRHWRGTTRTGLARLGKAD